MFEMQYEQVAITTNRCRAGQRGRPLGRYAGGFPLETRVSTCAALFASPSESTAPGALWWTSCTLTLGAFPSDNGSGPIQCANESAAHTRLHSTTLKRRTRLAAAAWRPVTVDARPARQRPATRWYRRCSSRFARWGESGRLLQFDQMVGQPGTARQSSPDP